MEKSSEAFRTIREVADAMDLPQHVLRFWETRFPQIRPLKRAGGRRYYRPDNVERLRVIRRLLYDEGYTIKGVQRLFKEQGAQELLAASGSRPAFPIEAAAPPEIGRGFVSLHRRPGGRSGDTEWTGSGVGASNSAGGGRFGRRTGGASRNSRRNP